MAWEKVYTVNRFYDVPTLGVADYCGVPHIFEAKLEEMVEAWESPFYLSEVASELMSLIMENWDIWIRWKDLKDKGEVDYKSFPLPEDQKRHKELTDLIGGRLKTEPDQSIMAIAEFRKLRCDQNSWEVRWKTV